MKKFVASYNCKSCYFYRFPEIYCGEEIGLCVLHSSPKHPFYTHAASKCSDCMAEKKGLCTTTTAPLVHSPSGDKYGE